MASTRQVEFTVLGCRDLPKRRLLGKMSPYLIVKNGDQEFRSETIHDGDKDPTFNERFTFLIAEDRTVVDVQILNEKKGNESVGHCRVDVAFAYHKGEFMKTFPVTSHNNQPQGSISVSAKCPVVVKELQEAAAKEAHRLEDDRAKYTHALVTARSKYYGAIPAQMAPHEVVTGALFDDHLTQSRSLQAEEDKEMNDIMAEPRTKAAELVDQAATEWASLAKVLLEDIPESMEEHCKESKDRFERQLKTLTTLVGEADKRRTDEVQGAKAFLLGGLDDLLSRYRSRIVTACDRYDETVKGGVLRYKGEVEAVLRSDAEAKSVTEASAVAPPPPAPTVSPHRSPMSSPQPGRSPRASPTARSPALSPTRAYPAAPSFSQGMAPAPVPVVVVAPAPVPAGYPMTQTERAQADARQAQSDAQMARVQADRAAMEAEAARRQAAESQEMMRQQMEAQMRARAVRRGVVGGVVLARAIRR